MRSSKRHTVVELRSFMYDHNLTLWRSHHTFASLMVHKNGVDTFINLRYNGKSMSTHHFTFHFQEVLEEFGIIRKK